MANTTKPTFGPYILGRTIGEGEFGKVKLANHKSNLPPESAPVAIKLIKKASVNSAAKRTKLMREISILQALSHPFIVTLKEVIETDAYIGMIMEYASGGELFEHILALKYLKEPEACRFFAQLVSAVHYLHSNNYVHRDLKLENLLLDKDRNIIITDFGFANRTGDTEKLMTTSCGSPCYAAPELVISDGYVGESADIWSCGVILFAMLCGYLPFDDDPTNPDGDNINLLYKYILETELVVPDYVSADATHLLKRMLVPDPKHRAKMFEVFRHPWMKPYRHIIDESREYTQKALDAAGDKGKQTSDHAAVVPIAPMAIDSAAASTVATVPSGDDSPSSPTPKQETFDSDSDNDTPPPPVITPTITTKEIPYDQDTANATIVNSMEQEPSTKMVNGVLPISPGIFGARGDLMREDLDFMDMDEERDTMAPLAERKKATEHTIEIQEIVTQEIMLDYDATSPIPASSDSAKQELTEAAVLSPILEEEEENVGSAAAFKSPPASERSVSINELNLPGSSLYTEIMEQVDVGKSSTGNANGSGANRPSSPLVANKKFDIDEGPVRHSISGNRPNVVAATADDSKLRKSFDAWFGSKHEKRGGKSKFKAEADAEEPIAEDGASTNPIASLRTKKSNTESRVSVSTFNSSSRPYKLRFHTGAIDQRALTNRPPVELLADLINMVRESGMYVRQSSSESTSFKLKIVRPAKHVDVTRRAMDTSDAGKQRSKQHSKPVNSPSFLHTLQAFPKSFISQMRYRAKYGTGYNKAFNQTNIAEPEKNASGLEQRSGPGSSKTVAQLGEIKFYVEIQKIKNLSGLYVVEFKRRQGDIWEFKRLYQEMLPMMKLDFNSGV